MNAGVVVAAIGFGVLMAVCCGFLLRGGAPRLVARLFGGVAGCLLLGGALHPVAPWPANRLAIIGLLVLTPVLLLLYPTGRPAPAGGGVLVFVLAATGVLSLLAPEQVSTGTFPIVQLVGLIGGVWWRFERSDEVERRALLWLVLGAASGGLLAGHIAFLVPSDQVAAILSAVAVAALPVTLTVGLLHPDVVDVRVVTTRTVVEATTLITAVALFVGAINVVREVSDRPTSTATQAVVAALCAVGYHPLRVALLGTIDRLLFGEREDPVRAASHVGRTLEDPVLALRALREALALPYAALVADGEPVAVSGPVVAAVASVDLALGERIVGRLDVGLRPGELRLSRRDRSVLEVVAPALAQTLHALALTRQLHDSRAGVIAAVEDERRRLRHDLHDTVGPTLTGIAYAADAARNNVVTDPDRASELLLTLRADTAAAIDDVRRVVEGLRPPAVDELGLVGALRQQVVSRHAADGRPVAVRLEAPEPLPALPAAVEVAAYRIVTEALTNVLRHAACHEATICLAAEGRRLVIEVRDTGRATGSWVPGVGLTSMRERAEQLGGSFAAERDGSGGRVRAVLPLG